MGTLGSWNCFLEQVDHCMHSCCVFWRTVRNNSSSGKALLLGEFFKRPWEEFQHDVVFAKVAGRGLTGWEWALQELERWKEVQRQLGSPWLPSGG